MYRIDDPSAVASRPAATALATEGWFLRGIAGGAQGTVVTAEQKNMVQAEMEAIRALNPTDPGSDKTDDEQLAAAILARIHAELGPVCSGFHTTWDDQYLITTGPGRATSDISASYINATGSEQKSIDVAWSQGGVGGAPSGLGALGIGARYPFFVGWNDDSPPLVTHGWDLEANAATAALLVADTGYAHWKRIGWHKVEEDSTHITVGIQRYLQDIADPTRWFWNLEKGAGLGKSEHDGLPDEGFVSVVADHLAYDLDMPWTPPNCVANHIIELQISEDVALGQIIQLTVADGRMWPVHGTDYGASRFWWPMMTGFGHGIAATFQSTYGAIQIAHGAVPELVISSSFATGVGFEVIAGVRTHGWIDSRGVHK